MITCLHSERSLDLSNRASLICTHALFLSSRGVRFVCIADVELRRVTLPPPRSASLLFASRPTCRLLNRPTLSLIAFGSHDPSAVWTRARNRVGRSSQYSHPLCSRGLDASRISSVISLPRNEIPGFFPQGDTFQNGADDLQSVVPMVRKSEARRSYAECEHSVGRREADYPPDRSLEKKRRIFSHKAVGELLPPSDTHTS